MSAQHSRKVPYKCYNDCSSPLCKNEDSERRDRPILLIVLIGVLVALVVSVVRSDVGAAMGWGAATCAVIYSLRRAFGVGSA